MGTGGLFLRKIRAKVADEPTGFVWIEKGKLAASGYPASRSQVEWLASQGVSSILTLTEAPLPSKFVKGSGITLGHVPLRDHAAPDMNKLKEAVAYLVEQIGSGRVVLVHCLAGAGRTGCVIASYMIEAKGLDPQTALRNIRETKPNFVERAQETSIFRYAELFKR